MTVLLVGGAGLLGKKLRESCPENFFITATYLKNKAGLNQPVKLDITSSNQAKKVTQLVKPDVVIHAASLGNVDYCEKHKKEAWEVNVEGTKNLLKAAESVKAKFIFFSSNAVFDGKTPPYTEDSKTLPINYYGKTKAAAERVVKQYFNNSILFRLNTMYGWNETKERSNPATWILNRLKRNLVTPVVTDVSNNHLWAGQAAAATWTAIIKEKYGHIFHIAGKDCISRFNFCRKVAQVFNLNKRLITPVKSDHFSKLAPRPKNTCFATTKMERVLGIQPLDIVSGLKIMKEERGIW